MLRFNGLVNRFGGPIDESLFWLNDEHQAKINPLIPMNRPDQSRGNSRRILSGMCSRPDVAGRTVLRNTAVQRHLFGRLRRSRHRLEDLPAPISKTHRWAGGGKGRPRNRRWVLRRAAATAKLHALVDKLCRPGNVADCTVGPEYVSLMAGHQKAPWRQGL
jgi:hypothetical protein